MADRGHLSVRGGPGQLTLCRDRLVLSARPHDLALPWSSITQVQAGTLSQDTVWEQPHGGRVRLPAGPALRVTGAQQHWVVPVADAEAARQTVERRRASWSGEVAQPPDARSWRRAAWLVRTDERQRRRARLTLRTLLASSPHFFFIASPVCLMLAAVSLTNVGEPGWRPSSLLGTLFFAVLGILALLAGLRLRAARRLLTLWPRPPGSAPDPATVPVPGWTSS